MYKIKVFCPDCGSGHFTSTTLSCYRIFCRYCGYAGITNSVVARWTSTGVWWKPWTWDSGRWVPRAEKTSDAVKILHDRYVGDDPEKQKALDEERRRADEEQAEFDRTGVDPYETKSDPEDHHADCSYE